VFCVLYGDLQESLWCIQCNVIAGSHLPVKLDNDLQDCKSAAPQEPDGRYEGVDVMHSQVGQHPGKALDNPQYDPHSAPRCSSAAQGSWWCNRSEHSVL